MSSNFYRVCVDRYVAANKEFVITDCLHNSLHTVNKARCEMLKLVDDAISIKSLKLEFEKYNDDSIGIFSIDGNGNKLYNVIYYVTEVIADSNDQYNYRNFEIFKNHNNWFIRSSKSGVISYKSELNEALLYVDCIIAAMKNIENFNKYIQIVENNE